MLVLTRKENESIFIGKNIEIKIIKTESGKVKIGIEAPKDVEINRKEVYEKIQNENKEAISKVTDFNKMKEIYKKNNVEK
jgi:carbon storage regulator